MIYFILFDTQNLIQDINEKNLYNCHNSISITRKTTTQTTKVHFSLQAKSISYVYKKRAAIEKP